MASRARRPALSALATALALASLALSVPAAAQAPLSAADRETARTLLDRGWNRMDAKDFAAALTAFQGAHDLMHLPTTGTALAQAQVALGLLLEARDTALQITNQTPQPGESPAFAQARAEAHALADQLAPRIPSLQIQLSATPPGLVVTVDGATVPPAALQVPRRVDPGKHVVIALAPGFEGRLEVTAAEGQTVPVVLTLTPARSARGASAPIPPLPLASAAPDAPPPRAGGLSPLVPVGFSIGGASLLVMAITGGLSLHLDAKIAGECQTDKSCPMAAHGDLSSANTLANVANVTFGVGLAGVATGILGLVLSPRAPRTSAAPTLAPFVGPGTLGVGGVF